jgi:diguanylate cyclase (GGDEF)-like protein/PAS domain S-box-containing protein
VSVPVLAACLVAAVVPHAGVVGDAAMGLAEAAAAVVMWIGGRRSKGRGPGWRLLAVALLIPVVWALVTPAGGSAGGMTTAYFSWTPTIPAYLLAICASFTFLDRARLRAGGLRFAVELLLFATACFVVTEFLVLGSDGSWGVVSGSARIILAAAVLTMSASMGMGLTLLGLVDVRRHRMARALLAGSVLMTAGQCLGASPVLAGSTPATDVSRFLVVAGTIALTAAALADPGSADVAPRRTTGHGCAHFRQVAPHVAMFVATLSMVVTIALGQAPGRSALGGVLACVGLSALHRWLSARHEYRMRTRLRRSESYFRSLVRSSGDAVLILDEELRVSWASTALERMVGAAAATELVGRPVLEAVHPEDVAALTAALPRGGEDEDDDERADPGLILLRLRDSDGTWRFLEAGVSDLRRDTDVGAVVLHCRDMTERHAREQALQSVAYTDPMTGLPNRAGWLRAAEQRTAAADAPAALLIIELEGLADARESTGRDVVTAVVAEIGRRLRATVRGEDLVARLGGGAFAVLADGRPDETDQLAARCLAVIEQPLRTAGGVLELTGSVGVVSLEAGVPVEELRSRAELAARAARTGGLGRSVRYSAALGEAAARRDRLRADLEGAADRGELSLAFQPVVSTVDQRVTGVEALLRWQHPRLGQIPPAEMLPIAERAGLSAPLHRWVLAQATTAVAALPSVGEAVQLGVNISAGYLAGGTAVADVQAALEASGLPAERLVLEITEAAMSSEHKYLPLDIETLRLMGVHVALDDFGTGASTLGHLTRLPLDHLKIDGALVARVDKDPRALALCESIVGIGRALGLRVGAEGVETPAQLAALCGIGCSFAQGFLIARPMPFGAFAALLEERAGMLWPGLVGHR